MIKNIFIKNETPVLGSSYLLRAGKLKRGSVYILVIFQDTPTFSKFSKGLGESFSLLWLKNVGMY